jgi:hypothetical protein
VKEDTAQHGERRRKHRHRRGNLRPAPAAHLACHQARQGRPEQGQCDAGGEEFSYPTIRLLRQAKNALLAETPDSVKTLFNIKNPLNFDKNGL